MKKITLLLFLLSFFAFSTEKQTESEIKEVTVYLNGAQITRKASIFLSEGMNEVILNNLSPLIDENSIQVSRLKNSSVLSIQYYINYLDKKETTVEIEKLILKIRSSEKNISLQENIIKGLKEEEALITANRKLATENRSVSLETMKEYAFYYRERIEAISNSVYEAKLKINEYENELRAYKQQLEKLSDNTKERRGEIKLKLSALKALNLNLEIKYNVTSAGWFPVYDIQAENISSPLNLQYRAHIYQKTGEDWKDVKITLSTGDPSINNSKPELNTHYLHFVNRNFVNSKAPVQNYNKKYNPMIRRVTGVVSDARGPLPGANVIIKGTNYGTTTDFNGEYTIDIEEGETIVYSYIGSLTYETPIYSSVINVQLEDDLQSLNEVVVIGYGSNNKNSSVRGRTSVEGNNILYILDGAPIDDISHISNDKIESIEVLDNASATEIYGAISANKIIIITTKQYTSAENLVNKEFHIEKAYSIPSISDITAINIDAFEIPVKYHYQAAPIINENVFLIAEVEKWEKFDLLPGEANIYFNGSYAGKTYIDPLQINKKLKISMGIDPNIVVTRNQVNNMKDKSFMGNNRIINRVYELTIKNNKDSSLNIVLLDRVPVSQDKEIKVDNINYQDADYDGEKGIIKWDLTLSPSETIEKKVSYEIKFPKYKRINLL